MTRRFAYLIAATLALAAAPPAVMSASPAPRPVEVVDILVDGVAQPRFAHGGRWYVEARKGREYAIRLRNPYGVRVGRGAVGRWAQHHRCARDDGGRRPQMGARSLRDDRHQRMANEPDRGAAIRIHDRGKIVRPGPRQDGQPRRDLGGLLQGTRGQIRAGNVEGQDRQPAAERVGGGVSPSGRATNRASRTSTPPPAWVAGPATRSSRCGSTSKNRPRTR